MIKFQDNTIRDGLQQSGLKKSIGVKLKVLERLRNSGVASIEIGMCAAQEDLIALDKMIGCMNKEQIPVVLTRLKISDLDYNIALRESHPGLTTKLLVPVSHLHIRKKLRMTEEELQKQLILCIEYLQKHGQRVDICLEDATRADRELIFRLLTACNQYQIGYVTIADTVGCAIPTEYGSLIKDICNQGYRFGISVHCHNDLGLATANTLAGVLNGAHQVECTFMGIGERAGNAAIEEVAYILHKKNRMDVKMKFADIYHLSKEIQEIVGYQLSPTKPILGENVFVHEAGIHQNANLVDRDMYQFVDPMDFGVETQNSISGISSRKIIEEQIKKQCGICEQNDNLVNFYRGLSKFIDGMSLEEACLLYEYNQREKIIEDH